MSNKAMFLKYHPEYLYAVHSGIDEYSKKYFLAINKEHSEISIVLKDLCFSCLNYQGKHYTIHNGIRKTTDSPQTFNQRIFLLGSSYTFGARVADKYTIASYLQRYCNEFYPDHWRILNLGVLGAMIQNHWLQCRYSLLKKGLSSGDTVIIILHRNDISKNYTRYALTLYNYFKEIHVNVFVLMWPRIDEFILPSPLERILATYSSDELYDHLKYKSSSLPSQRKYTPCAKCLDKSWIDLLSYDWCHDLQPEFERPHKHGEIFIDKIHISPKGNQVVADFIFQTLIKNIVSNKTTETRCHSCDDHGTDKFEQLDAESIKWLQRQFPLLHRIHSNKGLIRWLKTITRFDSALKNKSTIGCIVMNCNPMTLGHVYCIQKALEIADYLYVFVVKEDKSMFPFRDRFHIVKTVCAREFNDRVCVVPSGEFIISSFSFPGYFTKETKKLSADDRDASFDAAIFGSMIAPALNITRRFVGEEPFCPVTREYNEIMLKILPPMGVKVHVFPRKQSGADPISASHIRNLLSVKDFDAIQELVPAETCTYLLKRKVSAFPSSRIIATLRRILRYF